MIIYIKSLLKQVESTKIEIPFRGNYISYIKGNKLYLDDDNSIDDITEEEYIYIIQQIEKHYDI